MCVCVLFLGFVLCVCVTVIINLIGFIYLFILSFLFLSLDPAVLPGLVYAEVWSNSVCLLAGIRILPADSV